MAIIDIVVGIALIAFALFGIRTGFMRGVLSFVSTFIAILIAFALARPIANLLDGWFKFSEPLGRVFNGSAFENIANNNGFLFFVLICGFALFVLTKVAVIFLKRLALKLKDRSKVLNTADRILGLGFGVFRFCLWVLFASGAIFVLSQINVTSGIHDWLFENSSVAVWVYDRMIDWFIIPLFNAIGASGLLPS